MRGTHSHQYTILVVDDQPVNLQMLMSILSRQGHHVVEAISGQDALAKIPQTHPDLILLDVMLPDDDGYSICRQLRANKETQAIPVIFISALDDIKNKIKAFEAGGLDYITKPFHVDEVLARVETHLTLDALRRELEQKNRQLQQEIAERQKVETELHAIKNQLEQRVSTRTAELQQANKQLSAEIQERKNAERALRQSQERLALAIAETGGALWDCEMDPTAGFDDQPDEAYFSTEEMALLGYQPHEDIPHSVPFWDSHVLAEDLPEKRESARSHFYDLTEYLEHDYRIRRKDGEIRWIHSRSRIIRDKQGRPVRWIGIDWDITESKNVQVELKMYRDHLEDLVNARTKELQNANEKLFREVIEREKAETALRESQAQYQLLFNGMLDGYALHEIICDNDGKPIDYKFLDVNPAFERHTGLNRDIIGKTVLEVLPETEPYWIETYGRVALTGIPVQFEDFSSQVNQKWFEVIAISPVKYQFATIFHDVTDRKQAQTQLEQRHRELLQLNAEYKRLNEAIEQAAESIIITDTAGKIIYVNPAFEHITGYSRAEVEGKNPRLLKSGKHNQNFYQKLWQTIAAGQVWQGRFVNKKKDGTLFTEDATISPVRTEDGAITHFVAVKHDITRELQLEEQYHQAQKMESLGRLTGGVAHDFNNLLTAINGFAELIQMQLAPDDPRQPMLKNILHSGHRATDLVRQLLAFSRKQIIKPQLLDLNDVVSHMEKMLQRIIGEDIHLETDLAPDLEPILLDPAQLEQIIINLAVNARDAMPGGGKLRIETRNVLLNSVDVEAMLDLSPGRHILLTVSDSGNGIPEDILNYIFEPFFTTKDVGKGTGLGLATVYGIIKQNNGDIQVSSSAQGTRFMIYLPRAEMTLPSPSVPRPQNDLPTGDETILIVEDDVGVRQLTSHILEELGYHLLKAGNGQEALKIAQEHSGQIDLLLTDVVMPDIDGVTLAGQLVELCPTLKVVFMSGYSDSALARHGVPVSDTILLNKPFSASTLARLVKDNLDK